MNSLAHRAFHILGPAWDGRAWVPVCMVLCLFWPTPGWTQTVLSDLTLQGTASKLDDGAELTLLGGSVLTAAPGSIVDLKWTTLALPDSVSLVNATYSGTGSQFQNGASLTFKNGSALVLEAGSSADFALGSITFPSTVVLTSGAQTLGAKTLVEPVISSIFSAPTENLTLSASGSGATLTLGTGSNGSLIATSTGAGNIALLPGSGIVTVNGGAINRVPGIPEQAGMQIRGVAGGDVLQLYSTHGSGHQPFFRVNDANGTIYIGSNMIFSGRTADSSNGGFAVPYTGDVPAMLSIQSDLGSVPGTAAIVIQSGGVLSDMIAGFDNDTSTKKFAVSDGGLVTAHGGVVGGPTGLTLSASGTAAQNLTLEPSTSGHIIARIPALGASFQVKGAAAYRPALKLAAIDIPDVDLIVTNYADLGSNSHVDFLAGAADSFKIYHNTGNVEFISDVRSSTLTGRSTGLTITGSTASGQPLVLRPSTGGASVVVDLRNGGSATSGFQIKNTAARHPNFSLQATDVPNVDFVIYNWADQGTSSHAVFSGGAGDSFKVFHNDGRMVVLPSISSTSTTTGAFQVIGGVGIGGDLNLGGRLALRGGNGPAKGLLMDSVQNWYAANANQLTYDQGGTGDAFISIRGGTAHTMGIKAGSTSGGTQGGFVAWSDVSGSENLQLGVGSSEVIRASGTNLATGNVRINYTTASSSPATGALQIAGGAGIAGSLNVGQNAAFAGTVALTATTDSTTTSSGSLIVSGGLAIQKKTSLGDDLLLVPTTSDSATIRISGTAVAGVPGIWFRDGGSPAATNVALSGSSTTTTLNGPAAGAVSLRVGDSGVVSVTSSQVTIQSVPLNVTNSTASTSTTTGSAVFAGGVGVAGRTSTSTLNVGAGSTVDLVQSTTASLDFPTISGGGGVQDLTVTLNGATVGDAVNIVEAGGSFINAGIVLRATVTAPNTVTVRATNVTASSIDPASLSLRVTLLSF